MNIISHWLKMRKFHEEKEKIHLKFKDVDPYEPDPIESPGLYMMDPDYEIELKIIDDKIHALKSNYIEKKADSLSIPIPVNMENGLWEKSKFSNRLYLTTKGMREIKKEIREDYKYYLLWIASLTGLLGIVTGLIATIKS